MKNTNTLLKNNMMSKLALCILFYISFLPIVSHALNVEYRKLDCIPELQHYSFGGSFVTDSWHLIDTTNDVVRKELWEKHRIVNDTGPYYSILQEDLEQSTEFEDINFFEHECNINLGIRTKVRAQGRAYNHGVGQMMEQIQLFYGDIPLLDSLNEFGCYSFSDTKCRHFEFSIPDIKFFRNEIIITAAAKIAYFDKGYFNDLSEYPSLISNPICPVYFMDITIPVSISTPYNPGVIEMFDGNDDIPLPLTRNKIKQIMILEYEASKPRFRMTDSDEISEYEASNTRFKLVEGDKIYSVYDDQCYFNIKVTEIY